MGEMIYGLDSLLIATLLLVTMSGALEAGHRIGRRRAGTEDKEFRAHVNALQASMLGMLALLLGFTFSLALQRYDSRSQAVVDEANAIGTTYLRSHLLPASVRDETQRLLQSYIDLRVQSAAVTLDHRAEHEALLLKTNGVLDALWGCARRAAQEDDGPVTTGLFIGALNETIDAYGRREAALSRHVPEEILLLLFTTFLLTGGVVGYAAGLSGHRPSAASYLLILLIVLLALAIADLDRPRRGLIQVDKSSLYSLKEAIDAERAGASLPAGTPRPAVTGRN